MKHSKQIILLLIGLMLVCSCTVMNNTSLTKTRQYIGLYESSYPVEKEYMYGSAVKYTLIKTSYGLFKVKGKTENIPNNAWCYIRIEPAYGFHSDLAWQIEGQFFTWEGTEKEYKLIENQNIRIKH